MIRILLVMLAVLLGGTHAGHAACSATTNGTPQTLSFLTSSDFQDGRVAGAISADCFRDLAASVYGSGNNNINLKNLGLPTGGDDTAAINSALSSAKTAGVAVYAPAATYKHAGVILVDSVCLYGDGTSTNFNATDTTNPNPQLAIKLVGSNACLYNTQESTTWAGTRQGAPEAAAIYVAAASYFTVDKNNVTANFENVVANIGGTYGKIINNTAISTQSDSYYNATSTHDVLIAGNQIINSGDDCYSIDSYSNETQIYNMRIEYNYCYNGGARGLEISGGRNITEVGNVIDTTNQRCIFIASESSSFQTLNVDSVTFTGNVCNANGNTTNYAESVLIFGETGTVGATHRVSNVVLEGNIFTNEPGDCIRIGLGSTALNENNITFVNNNCNGAGPNGGNGVNLNGGSNVKVMGNTFANYGYNGVQDNGSNSGFAQIVGNSFNNISVAGGSAGAGIAMSPTAFTKVTIRDNTQITGTNAPAALLQLSGVTYAVVDGNMGDNHTQTVSGITTGWFMDPFNNTLKIGGTTVTVP